MCTLTFIPKSLNGFVLTSNRDESPLRETIVPAKYEVDGVGMIFPKDAEAGGTWIGASNKKRLICLLNGGFIAHQREENYRISRGLIVTQLLASQDVKEAIFNFDFNGVEPFTIVVVDWGEEASLFELVWDGTKHYFDEKPWAPYIWSSSLLYDSKAKDLRKKWFSDFLFDTIKPDEAEILHFHKTAGKENDVNALVMDRGFVKTKSITQVLKVAKTVTMKYENSQSNTITTISL